MALPDFRCERCGEGTLVLVSDADDVPLYFCPRCEHYKGDLLRRGRVLYYDTALLRVAQSIDTFGHFEGGLRLPTPGHEDALANRVAKEAKLPREKVDAALARLEAEGVLRFEPHGSYVLVRL